MLAESKVSDLESCLSMLEMGGPPNQPPSNAAYFTPQAATFHHPPPPETIHVPPPPAHMAAQQWPPQATQFQLPNGAGLQQRRKKRRNNGGGYGGGYGASPFGMAPNPAPPPPTGYGNHGNPQQYNTGNHFRQPNQNAYCPPNHHGQPQGRQPGGRANDVPYSNAIKQHRNLCYCFSCGYDVDHQGFQCPMP